MSSALVLLNPFAGGGLALRLEAEIRTRLRTDHPGVRLVVTSTIEETHQLIADTDPDSRIVLVGGDGTINRALPAIIRSDRELGVVPLGSGNDAARALGLFGMPWANALRHALTAPSTHVDAGVVTYGNNEVPFLACCTCGFDSAVALRAINGPRWLRGLPRYLLATLRELVALRHWNLTIHCEGRPLRAGVTLFASALNTPTFGSGIPAVPHASIADGKLDLLVAGHFSRNGAMMMLPQLLRGKHLKDARLHTNPFKGIEIRAMPDVPIAVDGEYLGEVPHLMIDALPASLRVVARTAITPINEYAA
jgi:diacylglycerol kinase (ATP)